MQCDMIRSDQYMYFFIYNFCKFLHFMNKLPRTSSRFWDITRTNYFCYLLHILVTLAATMCVCARVSLMFAGVRTNMCSQWWP